jgi:nitrate/nitrite transporter NarK
MASDRGFRHGCNGVRALRGVAERSGTWRDRVVSGEHGRDVDSRAVLERTDRVPPSVTAAAGIATINAIGNLAGFASPYMIGYLKDLTGRTDIALLVIASGLVLGAFWLR